MVTVGVADKVSVTTGSGCDQKCLHAFACPHYLNPRIAPGPQYMCSYQCLFSSHLLKHEGIFDAVTGYILRSDEAEHFEE